MYAWSNSISIILEFSFSAWINSISVFFVGGMLRALRCIFCFTLICLQIFRLW